MSAVASSSATNLMDAHNLAIVLAPNLLPVLNNGSNSKKSTWFTEDHLLSSTISVIEVGSYLQFLCRNLSSHLD